MIVLFFSAIFKGTVCEIFSIIYYFSYDPSMKEYIGYLLEAKTKKGQLYVAVRAETIDVSTNSTFGRCFLLQRNSMAFCPLRLQQHRPVHHYPNETANHLLNRHKLTADHELQVCTVYGDFFFWTRRLFLLVDEKQARPKGNKSWSWTMLETEEKNAAFVAGIGSGDLLN